MAETSIIGIGTAILTIFLLFIIVKQIIGLPGYTIYYPLLASLTWIIVRPFVDWEIIALMIITATTGRFMQKGLTKKYISLLLYPRQGFYIGISIFLLMLSRRLCSRRNIVSRQISEVLWGYVILMYGLILFITPKVFGQGKGIFSLQRWLHNIWFMMLTALCITILSHHQLIQIFETYPFISLIIFFLCIILGKYQGLHIMEMLRFRKLIYSKKKQRNKYTDK